MKNKKSIRHIKKYQGLALLVFVIAIALTSSIYYFSNISIAKIHTDNTLRSLKVLKQAKLDLLAYAMNYRDMAPSNPDQGPGNFPCPDDTLDGLSNITTGVVIPGCNSLTAGTLGRYPWKTIGTQDFTDASGEALWYAISANFVNQANQNINSSSKGGINVLNKDGALPPLYDGTSNDAIVAVIFAPGKPLVRNDGVIQKRITTSEKNDPKNYLDIAYGEDNADFTNSNTNGFIQGEISKATGEIIVNDQMVVITHNEIMNLIREKVGEVINNLIDDYFLACGAYPEASIFNPVNASFNSAGQAPPNELRQGHLPLGNALPYAWGSLCPSGTASIPPTWLAAERWDATSYYAYAYQNAPPTNVDTCGNGTNPDCMTVNSTIPLISNAQAVVIFSGRDTTAGNRPSNAIADYFEGDNNNLDDIYDAAEIEDYIKVITP